MILSQKVTPQKHQRHLRECQEHESLQAPRRSASSHETAGIMLLASRDRHSF